MSLFRNVKMMNPQSASELPVDTLVQALLDKSESCVIITVPPAPNSQPRMAYKGHPIFVQGMTVDYLRFIQDAARQQVAAQEQSALVKGV